jgi:hypothetical protein
MAPGEHARRNLGTQTKLTMTVCGRLLMGGFQASVAKAAIERAGLTNVPFRPKADAKGWVNA